MKKILVSYFSASGSTKRVAKKIADLVDADMFEIEPLEKYTDKDLDWTDRESRSTIEMKNRKYRPPVLNKLENAEDYDSIVLGFPVWWYTAPTVVNTFIEENNLSGKDAYVFVTSGATGVEGSLKDLKKTYPDINFISGKRFNGSFPKSEVLDWIK